MELPQGNGYESLMTKSVAEKLDGDSVAVSAIEEVVDLEYPLYILEHNNYATLPHSIEAILGLLNPDAQDKASVYITSDIQTDSKLIYLGSGDKYVLESMLSEIVDVMYAKHMNVYYVASKGSKITKIKINDLSKLRLHL